MTQTSLGVFALAFTLLCNVCGLVWGAAKLSAAVTNLQKATDKLSAAAEKQDHRINNHETRITVLETVSAA